MEGEEGGETPTLDRESKSKQGWKWKTAPRRGNTVCVVCTYFKRQENKFYLVHFRQKIFFILIAYSPLLVNELKVQ